MNRLASPAPTLNAGRVGPFDAAMARRQPNREGQVLVRMRAGTLAQLTQIGTWIGGWDALAACLAPLMPVPAATGQTVWQDGDWIARTGPEDMLVIAAPGSPLPRRIAEVLPPQIGHSLDLSHARCRLRMQGPGVVPSLRKLFALDFREPAFAVSEVRLSGSHHLPALLHRTAPDAFDLYVHTTYAHDQVESVFDAALECGAELSLESP